MERVDRQPPDEFLLASLEDRVVDTVTRYSGQVPRPFGAVFSGGFDSGLMVALTKPDKLFRMKFPYGVKFDESRYADAVANHLGVKDRVTEVVVTPETFRENFAPAVKVMGEPTPHFSLVPLYILMKTMAEAGQKDVLSGEGPDEYMGGYARQIIFDELHKLYEVPELRSYHGMVDRVVGRSLLRRYADLIGYQVDDAVLDGLAAQYPLQGAIGKLDMEFGVIERMEQRLANHFDINFHYPYINPDLAEFCYQLPDRLKIRNGVTKWGFRQIAMKYLPELLRDRAKMGGPVAPVNLLMGWEDMGDFGKERYIEEQKRILG